MRCPSSVRRRQLFIFSTSSLKPLNGIQRNLTWSMISTSSTMFVFFGWIGKTRWPPWLLIDWGILDFSSETAERNSTKLDRKKDLNALYQVCVFRADWKTRWTFWLLIGWYLLTSLKLLNGIRFNLTGSKISTSSAKFVFFRLIEKTRWPPWLIRQKGGSLYSGARYVALGPLVNFIDALTMERSSLSNAIIYNYINLQQGPWQRPVDIYRSPQQGRTRTMHDLVEPLST